MQETKIVIPGRPVPKGRPRVSRAGKKVVLFTPGETVAYERRVHEVSARHFPVPLEKPLEVHILIFIDPDAKKATKTGKLRKAKLPDLDNIIKSLLDGMNKAAYVDDSQVRKIAAEMILDKEESAEVVIREIEKAPTG